MKASVSLAGAPTTNANPLDRTLCLLERDQEGCETDGSLIMQD